MATVREIFNWLDQRAPFRYQLDFDNAGFLVGRGERQVQRCLVALDITPAVIDEAIALDCQLIVAHHPVIWGKLGQVTDETITGQKVLTLVEKGIAAICAHTNLDAVEGGVNTQLAQRVGLKETVPLETDGGRPGPSLRHRPGGGASRCPVLGRLRPASKDRPGLRGHPDYGCQGSCAPGGGGGRGLRRYAPPGESHGL